MIIIAIAAGFVLPQIWPEADVMFILEVGGIVSLSFAALFGILNVYLNKRCKRLD
jgi:ABC-type polysaccharide transport system permease subunit